MALAAASMENIDELLLTKDVTKLEAEIFDLCEIVE
jgi:hypothetical protein